VKTTHLDIGCGKNKQKNYIGIDIGPNSDADCILDIEKERLPFDDESVDGIYTSHTLEHISDIIYVMNEFWRVLKWGSLLQIHVPHMRCDLAWQDPTHVRYFNEQSWKFFCGEYVAKHQLQYGINCCFRQTEIELSRPTGDANYCNMMHIELIKDIDHSCKISPLMPTVIPAPIDSKEPGKQGAKAGSELKAKLIETISFPEIVKKVLEANPNLNIGYMLNGIGLNRKEKAHFLQFKQHIEQILLVKYDATKRYPPEPADLGARGLFADLNRKHKRMKRFLWEGETGTVENLGETIYDNVVYLLLTLMEFEGGNIDGD